MDNDTLIKVVASAVKKELINMKEAGHDWWHTYRVWKLSSYIAKKYDNIDSSIVELAALLHDIADAKFFNGNEEIGPEKARKILVSLNTPKNKIEHVDNIIRNISFRHEVERKPFSSIELSIVQDADRLDAIGAIGIARAFNYGGFIGNPLYSPTVDGKKDSTVNHFYEKLLLLKDRMNTETARKLAEKRHNFMVTYLEHFFEEWDEIKTKSPKNKTQE